MAAHNEDRTALTPDPNRPTSADKTPAGTSGADKTPAGTSGADATGVDEKALPRVLTIPNAITTVRLLCIPLFVWLLFARSDRYAAAALLGALGATDWVDGFVARRYHQVSTVGKILDPTADRILLATAVISIVIDGSVPLALAIVVFARELLVAGAAIVLAIAGARRIDVQWAGKAGTFALMFMFPLFLVAHSTADWRHVAAVLAWVAAAPAVVFGWYSAITYIPMGKKALAEGRAERTAKMAVTGP